MVSTENGRGALGVVEALGGGHLHRLHLGHDLALDVAGDDDGCGGDQGDPGAELRGEPVGGGVGAVAVADQVPQGDRHQQGSGDEEGAGDGVREGDQGDLVGEHGDEVGQFGAAGVGVVAVADGVLHERVGGEDEVRREVGADGGGPDGGQVHAFGQPVPAEDPQADEGGFEEEGDQGLDGQGCAEDVADEAGVVAPVHAELELLHDAGDHAHGEVDQEEFAVEPGEFEVLLVPGAVPEGLQDGDQDGQADGQRYEEKVVDGGDTELPAGDVQRVHLRPPRLHSYYKT